MHPIDLLDNQYLMLGDNTQPGMSLDGRFFGGVPREDFRGRSRICILAIS